MMKFLLVYSWKPINHSFVALGSNLPSYRVISLYALQPNLEMFLRLNWPVWGWLKPCMKSMSGICLVRRQYSLLAIKLVWWIAQGQYIAWMRASISIDLANLRKTLLADSDTPFYSGVFEPIRQCVCHLVHSVIICGEIWCHHLWRLHEISYWKEIFGIKSILLVVVRWFL